MLSPKEEFHSVQLINNHDPLSLQQQVQVMLFEKAKEDSELDKQR